MGKELRSIVIVVINKETNRFGIHLQPAPLGKNSVDHNIFIHKSNNRKGMTGLIESSERDLLIIMAEIAWIGASEDTPFEEH
jgi:hypothetical protein